MKKKLLVLGLIMVLGVSFLGASTAYAAVFQGEEALAIQSPVDDDLYVAGGSVSVDEAVNGDLIVAGGTVEINGDVAEDLIILGGTVVINADVADDLRIGGGEVYLNGNVGDDLIAAGGNLSLSSSSVIEGYALIAGGTANIRGTVNGDLDVYGGAILFGAEVLGDTKIVSSDSLNITNEALMHGDLNYVNKESVELASGVVLGEVTFEEFMNLSVDVPERAFGNVHLGMKIWQYLGLLVVGLVMMLIAPYFYRNTAKTAAKEFWKSLFYGVMFMIGVPFVCFLLLFSVIGVKLAIITMVMWGLAWPFAKIIAAYFIGSMIVKPKKDVKFWRDFGGLALGLAIIFVVKMIPVFGWFACLIVVLTGLGSLIVQKQAAFQELRKQKLV